ncbi:MAG TPA: CDP-archaeol synthase [Chloroflexota bacterium]|nr:CDP-archaeol synthase [Chloroflexota bacterium]
MLIRLATALVAAPIVVLLTFAGGPWFAALVVLVAGWTGWELSELQRKGGVPASPVVTILASSALPLSTAFHAPAMGTGLLGLAIIGGLLPAWQRVPQSEAPRGESLPGAEDAPGATRPLIGWALALAFGLYVGVLLAPSIALRERPDGLLWLVVILGATWACDSAAYLIGRRWGKNRLVPRISPQKSREGTVAGLVASLVVTAVAGAVWSQLGLRVFALGFVIALGAVLGDLMESVIKRHLGAKDSGWVMPGHGGLLDRIDGLLVSSFLAFWYITLTDGFASR